MSAKMKSIVICTVVRTGQLACAVINSKLNLLVMSIEVKIPVTHWNLALDGINTITK